MKRLIVCLTLLCTLGLLAACGNETIAKGTIVELSADRAVVELTRLTYEDEQTEDSPVSGVQVTFPLTVEGAAPIEGAAVGDTVTVMYMGKLIPASRGDLGVYGWELETATAEE